MKNYCFNYLRKGVKHSIKGALKEIFGGKVPVIVCIGTDAVAGDSLGPLVGSLLKEKILGKTFIFGSLDCTITAKEIYSVSRFISSVYPDAPVLAVDAALGIPEEIGNLKLCDCPVKPGLGVNKNLASIGTASLIGVVEQKTNGKSLLSSVRFSLVYALAEIISSSLAEYINECTVSSSKNKTEVYPFASSL